MPLSEVTVRNAKPGEKQYKLADSHGLFLLVYPQGYRYWRMKYRFGGKEKRLSFGTYPDVSLKDARARRDVARALLAEGRDPTAVRKEEKRLEQMRAKNSFECVAREFAEKQAVRWSKKHTADVIHRLELYIFPDLGARPIAEIKPLELLDVIRKLEARGATELAHRMTQTCGQVFRYGVLNEHCERDVAADLRGALVPHVKKMMPAVEPHELPALLQAIKAYDGDPITRLGLQFLALTFVRTTELIATPWEEFDLDDALWIIPSERMKVKRTTDGEKRDQLVPLSRQTLLLLSHLQALRDGSRYMLRAANPWKHISNNTLLYALYRLGYHSRQTGHGFRALASTILNETREHGLHDFASEVIECQLAHHKKDKVAAVYNRAKYISTRRRMMQWWADYLDEQAGGQFVEPLPG